MEQRRARMGIYIRPEILERIFAVVDCDAVDPLLLVSKQWSKVCSSTDSIWSEKYCKDFGGDPRKHYTITDYQREWKIRHAPYELFPVHDSGRHLWKCAGSRFFGYSFGKDEFEVVEISPMQWTGRGRLMMHNKSATCIACSGSSVAVGFVKGFIGWWDLTTGKLVCMRKGHDHIVGCLASDEANVVSGSADCRVKVWGLEGECVLMLAGHSDYVRCVEMNAKRIVSGSHDMTVKVWNRKNGECLCTLWQGAGVSCLQLVGDRILSGCIHGKIYAWSIETGALQMEINGESDNVICLYQDGAKIISSCSGYPYHPLKIWDSREGTCIRQLDISFPVGFVHKVGDGYLLGGKDGSLHFLEFH